MLYMICVYVGMSLAGGYRIEVAIHWESAGTLNNVALLNF